jgi:hypothetical protein
MTRADILEAAYKCVCGQRDMEYGTPEDTFGRIAEYWTVYLGAEVTPVDVAIMMALLKVARIQGNTATMDSFIDLAGYAACGGELAEANNGQITE